MQPANVYEIEILAHTRAPVMGVMIFSDPLGRDKCRVSTTYYIWLFILLAEETVPVYVD